MDNYIAVLQAGGKGTRLRELTGNKVPKPLLELNGKPMLQWQIEAINRYGINRFIIITGYMGQKIKEYFGDGSRMGVIISYIEENPKVPLGSAGALYYLKNCLGDANGILLAFGDVMFDIDLCRMIYFHEKRKAYATLLVHPNSHPHDSDLVVMDEENRITKFLLKNDGRHFYYDNMVNAGISLLQQSVLDRICSMQNLDLEQDVLAPLLETGQVYGYHSTEYVKDAGTVDRFLKVEAEQKAGMWRAKNIEKKQKCIFLDRDGTLNQYRGLIAQPDALELEKNAAEAVRLINESEYLAICVTNQPVVARGMCTEDEVWEIHRKLAVLLGDEGAYLDDIIFCPHHPDRGYEGENPVYKVPCTCRKPAVGMIDVMAGKYNIDVSQSYIIGDSTTDLCLGMNAGMKAVLVETGQGGKDGKYKIEARYRAKNLYEAVRRILEND